MKKKLLLSILVVAVCATCLCAAFACDNSPAHADGYFADLRAEDASLAEEGAARIMCLNALVHMESWGGEPVKPRAEIFVEMIKRYAPDVVALQEFDGDWHKYSLPPISDDYAVIRDKQNWFQENRSPMIYNTNTLELIDEGYHIYSKKDNSRCRVVTWGVFKRKSDGAEFAVTSTHWDFGMEDYKVEYRTTQINELSGIVNSIREKYDCPVFAAGDYNSFERDDDQMAESYRKYMEVSGSVDVKFSEGVKQNILGDGATWDEQSWDHIFLKGDAETLSFNILSNDYYKELSDHFPIYIDVRL